PPAGRTDRGPPATLRAGDFPGPARQAGCYNSPFRPLARPLRTPLRSLPSMRRIPLFAALILVAAGIASLPGHLASHTSFSPDFVHFESDHVHPLAITPDGTRLLVVNTPDDRLSVFDLTGP